MLGTTAAGVTEEVTDAVGDELDAAEETLSPESLSFFEAEKEETEVGVGVLVGIGLMLTTGLVVTGVAAADEVIMLEVGGTAEGLFLARLRVIL